MIHEPEDLTGFENGFAFGGAAVSAELAWVQVSTDGVVFDAVAILNPADDPAALPLCDMEIDVAGFLVVRLGHPAGLPQLDPVTLSVSANLQLLPGTGRGEVVAPDGFWVGAGRHGSLAGSSLPWHRRGPL